MIDLFWHAAAAFVIAGPYILAVPMVILAIEVTQ